MSYKRTFEEILARQNAVRSRKHPDDEEHRIQCACVQWFNYQYPKFSHTLFAVPNGGRRDKVTGAKMKAEGVRPGVSDLILLKSNQQYGALLIEMKTRTGRQSEAQRQWQHLMEKENCKYAICRSLDDFIQEVEVYLSNC